MQVRKDIFGNVPQIGDTIVFNPPSYKGLVWGKCSGYTNCGLPKITSKTNISSINHKIEMDGYYAPRTEFVVVK